MAQRDVIDKKMARCIRTIERQNQRFSEAFSDLVTKGHAFMSAKRSECTDFVLLYKAINSFS